MSRIILAEKMELFERVTFLAKNLAGSRTKLASKLGIHQRTFDGYINLERQDNLWPILFKILETYPKVSRDWLFFGEGDMLQSENLAESPEFKMIEGLKAEVTALKDELLDAQRREIRLRDRLDEAQANSTASASRIATSKTRGK